MVERTINNKVTSTKAFASLYPYPSRFADINGHKMHYIDQGSGPPVIMVHGNPTWSFYYRRIIDALFSDFRAIAPDHIGCGLSDKPGTEDYDYTLARRAEDLNTFINSLDLPQKVNLVLHDWGGAIGLLWAVDHIERINKIVITNTAGFHLPKEKSMPFVLWLIKYLPVLPALAVNLGNIFVRGALLTASTTRLSSKVKKGLLEPYNSWKNRIATLKFVQDIPITNKDTSYATLDHLEKHLSRLDESRLMFLWGAKDFVFDLDYLNEFKRYFPRARTHVFHDAGHYLFEDKPVETSSLIHSFFS